jgi:site-specific recombinase XerD
MTVYGAGLRVSEVCNLKIKDIDSEYMIIFVRDGKGGKDRYTILSKVSLKILREYFKAYRPNHPDGWLFLNQEKTQPITIPFVREAFYRTLERSGIKKDASMYTLRRCFAPHYAPLVAQVICFQDACLHPRSKFEYSYYINACLGRGKLCLN